MNGPLEGVRVIDFTHTVAGLYGAMVLADQGAEVIKVGLAHGGAKGLGDSFKTGFATDDVDYRFIQLNRNKKSISLDLKSPAAKDVFWDLARVSDVVFDNYRPGVLTRLGIDYPALRKVNPTIISCSITAFGSTGPYRDRPAADYVVQGVSGLLSLTGLPGKPIIPGTYVVDLAAGTLAAQGIASALFYRDRSGQGQRVEVPLLDTAFSLMHYKAAHHLNTGIVPPPDGSKAQGLPLSGVFQTRDGFMTLMVLTPQQWQGLCQVFGRPDLAEDPRFDTQAQRVANIDAVNDLVESITRTWDSRDLAERLMELDIPCGPVNTLDKAFADPQAVQSGIVATTLFKGKPYKIVGNPIKMSGREGQPYGSPPTIGQHTGNVLRELLGYSAQRVTGLRDALAI